MFPQDKERTKQPSFQYNSSLELIRKHFWKNSLHQGPRKTHFPPLSHLCQKRFSSHTVVTRLVKRSSIGSAPSIANMSLAKIPSENVPKPKIFSLPSIFPQKKNSPLVFWGFSQVEEKGFDYKTQWTNSTFEMWKVNQKIAMQQLKFKILKCWGEVPTILHPASWDVFVELLISRRPASKAEVAGTW